MLDSTVVGIALPSISRDFHGGVGTLQWVVTGYALTLAAFLLLGGALGDHYGRRRVLLHRGRLVRRRLRPLRHRARRPASSSGPACVQGIGGALLAPGSLAILQTSFRPDDRARAIGAWSGLSGVAGAAGPLVGRLSPRRRLVALDLLHQPARLAAVLVLITARHVPESRDPDGHRPRRHRRRHPGRRVPRRPDLRAHRGADPRLVQPRRGGLPRGGRPGRRPPSSSSSTGGPTRCSRSSCSAPGSSAGPTGSPSPSTAPLAAPSSCSPSSCRSSRATARSNRASPCSP